MFDHNGGSYYCSCCRFLPALAQRFTDIFFLVDSGVSPTNFQQIRTTLLRLVNQMNIRASAYRLGLAQYGQNIKVEFLLKDYQTKEETQNAVKRFRQQRLQSKEPRNLGSALEYARRNFFTSEAGSRADQGYRQYLVVLSGKDSDDDVKKSSRLLKSAGIVVIGMNLGQWTMDEIDVIATRQYAYPSLDNAVKILKDTFEKEEEEVSLDGE